MQKPFSPLQQKVYDTLNDPADTDVTIRRIYAAAYNMPLYALMDFGNVSDMQQKLGPVIQRINEKLATGRVRPGDVKQTYRLDTQQR